MKFIKKDYLVLRFKRYEEVPFGGRYSIVEKNAYSHDDDFEEIKGKLAKSILEVAEKFDENKESEVIDGYKAIKIKEIPQVLLYLTEIE